MPAAADEIVGAPGDVVFTTTVVTFIVLEGGPVPITLVAVTEQE